MTQAEVKALAEALGKVIPTNIDNNYYIDNLLSGFIWKLDDRIHYFESSPKNQFNLLAMTTQRDEAERKAYENGTLDDLPFNRDYQRASQTVDDTQASVDAMKALRNELATVYEFHVGKPYAPFGSTPTKTSSLSAKAVKAMKERMAKLDA